MYLGRSYQDKGLLDLAIEEYQKGLALAPRHHDAFVAHNNLGVALLQKGRPEEAIEQFKKALAINPGYSIARENLGKIVNPPGTSKQTQNPP